MVNENILFTDDSNTLWKKSEKEMAGEKATPGTGKQLQQS